MRLIEDMNLKVDCTFHGALRSKYDTNLLLWVNDGYFIISYIG